jgi:type III secretory pathway component EscT
MLLVKTAGRLKFLQHLLVVAPTLHTKTSLVQHRLHAKLQHVACAQKQSCSFLLGLNKFAPPLNATGSWQTLKQLAQLFLLMRVVLALVNGNAMPMSLQSQTAL